MRKLTGYRLPATALLFAVSSLLFASPAHAVCPVCTVAVGAGLGLARYFGVDDTISGVWIGGIILSSSFWTADFLQKRKINFPYRIWLVTFAFYILVILPLYFTNIIGHPFNTILGIDKLVFGTAVGSLVFLLAVRTDKLVRKMNGKQLFVYQKVVFPLSSLVIMSLIFYLLIK